MGKHAEEVSDLLGPGSAIFSYLSGRPKIPIEEISGLMSKYVKENESIMGPIFLDSKDPWKYVAENGLGSKEPDIHLLDHIISLYIAQEEVSEYSIMIPISPGAIIGSLFDFNSLDKLASIFINNVDNPVQWVHIVSNDLQGVEQSMIPPMTFFRHVEDKQDLAITADMCINDESTGTANLQGFESLAKVITQIPEIRKLKEKMSNGVLSTDAISGALDDLLSLFAEHRSPFTVLELEYGPVESISKMARKFIQTVIVERTNRTRDLYKSERDKVNQVPTLPALYKNRSFSYLDGDIDIIKMGQKADCEECGICDMELQDVVTEEPENPESFFK